MTFLWMSLPTAVSNAPHSLLYMVDADTTVERKEDYWWSFWEDCLHCFDNF